jgi:hypothetical protein
MGLLHRARDVLAYPEFQDKLYRAPKLISRVVQAGLSIDGLLLQQALELIAAVESLQSQLGQEKMLDLLASVNSGAHMQELAREFPHFVGQVPPAKLLLEAFLGFSAMLPPKAR